MVVARTDIETVNVFTQGVQSYVQLAALSTGGYVAVWLSDGEYGSGHSLVAQTYSETGQRVGAPSYIESTTVQSDGSHSVVGLDNGTYAVTWVSGVTVFSQVFNPDGTPAGNQRQIEATTSTVYSTSTQLLPDGSYLVTYDARDATNGDWDIFAQRVNEDGSLSGSKYALTPNETGAEYLPSSAVLNSGDVVTAFYDSDARISVVTSSADGATVGSPVQIVRATSASFEPLDIVALAGGGFVVVWAENGGDSSGLAVIAQIFDADGDTVGTPFVANEGEFSTQQSPDVTATADGGFFVSWYSVYDVDGPVTYDIYGRGFDANGVPKSGDISLSEGQPGFANFPSVIELASGVIVAAWNASSVTGAIDADGVYQRLFSADGVEVILPVPPVVEGLATVRTVSEDDVNGAGVFLDSNGASAVSGPADFDGGRLIVARRDPDDRDDVNDNTNFTRDFDLVSINSQGTGTGQISVSGTAVSFGGTQIGTITGDGVGGADFIVEFNADATPQAVEAVVENLLYSNESDDPEESVELTIFLEDGDGGSADPVTVVINVVAVQDAPEPIGSDQQVNSYTTSTQTDIDVAALSDGGWISVWTSTGQDDITNSSTGIYQQRFNADGVPIGPEVLVNTQTNGAQNDASVAALSGGGWAVTWYDSTNFSEGYVRAQVYAADGTPVGGEIAVPSSTYSTQNQPDISGDDQGGFVIAWSATSSTTFSAEIFAQRFDATGAKIGSQILVNEETNGSQGNPSVTSVPGGGFVVSWDDFNSSVDPSTNINARIFDNNGGAVSGNIAVNTNRPNEETDSQITTLDGGGFVVTWTAGSGQDGSSDGVFAQVFDASGAPVGDETLVNEYTSSQQYQSAVTALPGGGFAVVWASFNINSYDVFVQFYAANGDRVDSEILVNSDIVGTQYLPTISTLANGDVIVGWVDTNGQDGSGTGVFQKIVGNPANYAETGNAPQLAIVNNTLELDESDLNAAPQKLLPAVAIGDLDSSDFGGGTLVITRVVDTAIEREFSSPDNGDQDQLGIANDGGITVSGSTVSFNGSQIGVITEDGTNGILSVDLNTNATPAAVEALAQAVTYSNISDDPASDRQFRVVVSDGDGGVSNQQIVTVSIRSEAEALGPVAGEVQVNSYTNSSQQNSDVAVLGDGGWVIVWESSGQDSSGTSIYAQRYAADGAPVGEEFLVDSNPVNAQSQGAVTGLSDGGWAITWYDSNVSGVRLQLYNANGTTEGSETVVETQASSTQQVPAIASYDGGFAVVWADAGSNSWDIKLQRFDNDGAAVGAELRVNTITAGVQYAPQLTAESDGTLHVVWEDQSGNDGSSTGIYMRSVAPNNTLGGAQETLVPTETVNGQSQASIAVLNDGRSVVIWYDNSGLDGSGGSVHGQLYAANGAAIGGQFLVNDITSSTQSSPDVAALANGGFAVVYESNGSQDGSGVGVFVQEYNADGSRRDGAQQVNEEFSSSQYDATIAATPTGYVVTWTSVTSASAGDESGTGVFARVFGDGSTPVTGNVPPELTELAVSIEVGADDATTPTSIPAQIIDNAIEISDVDSGFAGGALEIRHQGDGTTTDDQLSILDGKGITTSGSTVLFDGVAIGSVSGTEDGVDGADLRIDFNGNATTAAVQALAEQIAYGSTGFANLTFREVGFFVTDADGATSDGRTVSIRHRTETFPAAISLTDVDAVTVSEDALQAAPLRLDTSVDFDYNGTNGLDGGRVLVYSISSSSLTPAFETLAVANDGTGTGQISVSGDQVSYEGTLIGTIDATNNGAQGTTLRIDLGLGATAEAVDALLQAITFQNIADTQSEARTFRFDVYDAGNVRAIGDVSVTITPDDDGGPIALGDEEQVNSFTTGEQTTPDIAALADGGYTAVWQSYNQDGTFRWDIYAQRYDANGSPVGGEIRVSEQTNGFSNTTPVVEGLADGSFVVVWYASDGDIRARTFAADGTPGAEFVPTDQTVSTQDLPAVTALSNGNFLIAWSSFSSSGSGDGNSYGVIGRLFHADGTPVSDTAGNDDIVLNTTTTGSQRIVDVAANGSGGFVAVWEDDNTFELRFQRFDSAGAKVGSETLVSATQNSTSYGDPKIAELDDGGFIVVWVDLDVSGPGIFQQRYDTTGNAVGGIEQVNLVSSSTQTGPAVTATPNGGWVVSWQSSAAEDGSSTTVVAQAFADDGSRDGDLFIVNEEFSAAQYNSNLAALADGRIATIWESQTSGTAGDGSGSGVFTRLFGEDTVDVTSADPDVAIRSEITVSETAVQGGLVALTGPGTVAVGDIDSSDFAGGRLVLSVIDESDPRTQFSGIDGEAQDNLTFSGANVSISGGNVLVNGTSIGALVSDGQAGATLEIALNANATAETIETVLDALAYTNPSDDPDVSRSYLLVLSDGEGGTSERSVITINITPEVDTDGPIDGEAQVNSQSINNQTSASIAGLTGGGHVTVWVSTNQDNPGDNNTGVFGQLYDDNGQPSGTEFQINTTFAGAQDQPEVTNLANGGFAVVWEGVGAQGTGIYAQLFDASAQAVGGEFRINDSDQSEWSPRISSTDTGFAVVWEANNDIVIKTYDTAGNALTVATNITGAQSFSEFQPSVAGLADGRYVVSYSYNSTLAADASSNGVYAQIVNADGSIDVSEFLVNTDTLNSESDSDAAALVDGGFVITWLAGSAQDGSGNGVYAQVFNANGSPRGEEFLVNEYTSSNQGEPSVTGLGSGGFIISFTDASNPLDSSSNGVFVQQYDANGNRLDGARLVNEETASSQSLSDITALENGGFAVAWTSAPSGTAGDGDSNGVFQRIFGDETEYNVAGRPVIEGVNATRVFIENDINGTPQLIDANAAAALSDMDSSDFDGGFLRVDVVVAERGYADQFNAPDDLTQDQLGILGTNGVSVAGTSVSVDGNEVGTIVSNGLGGQTFQIALNADATVERVERLIENLSYRNASDDPAEVRTLQIQVADGDGGVSDPVRVQLEIRPSIDGVQREFTERQANTTTDSVQDDPAIAATDEGFVIVWRGYNDEPDVINTYGIFGQRFDANGNPIGNEFLVNTTQAGSQADPDVIGLSGGGFVVAWSDPNAPDGQDIFIQRYDGTGATVGLETRINTSGSSTEQDVELIELANGDLLAVWDSFGTVAGGSGWDVVGQIIDGSTGALIGSEFLINQSTASTQQDVSVSASPSGGFVATWRTDDGNADGSSSAIMARVFGNDADNYAPEDDEFVVNSTTAGAQQDSAVAVLANGSFVIVWQEPAADGSTVGVFGQLFTAAGTAVGQEFRVNDNRINSQYDPDVVALDNGGFAVTFSDNNSTDGSGVGVFLQQFNAQGNRIDGPVQVNTEFSSTQDQGEIANIGGGRLAVAYTSNTSGTAGDGSSTGIFYQLFNQVEPPISELDVSLDEDTTYVFTLADFDNALAGPLASIRIDVLPSAGQLFLDGVVLTGGEIVTAAQLTAGDLTFQPNQDVNGFDSFFWSGSTDGVTFTLIEAEGTVFVAPINDPVDLQVQPNLVVGESLGFNLSIPLTIGDPDTGDTYTVTVDYGEGNPLQVFNTSSKAPFIQNIYETEGVYTVDVTVDDNQGSVEQISFTVTVENRPPNAGNNFYSTDEDSVRSGVNIFSNDNDPGGDTFTLTAINGQAYTPGDSLVLPSGATLVIAANGALTYDPTTSASLQAQADGDFTNDAFTYTITDDDGLSDSATVTVQVSGSDDFDAQDDVLTVDEDSVLSGSLLADNGNGPDTDPEGDDITITQINGQTNLVGAPVALSGGGILTVQSDGSFVFDATGQYEELGVGETRVLTFTYDAIEDGEGDTANAQVEITVTGVNDDPTANGELVNLAFETASGEINLIANDFDIDGDTVVLDTVGTAANGTVQVVDNARIIYTPDSGFSGDDLITYTITDGNGGTAQATLTVRVAPPVSQPPVAGDDRYTINEDVPTTFDVLLNDSDPDGNSLTIFDVTQPANGSVSIIGNQIRFTPAQDFNGDTFFTYRINDGTGETDEARVDVTIEPVNDDPVAMGETVTLTEDTAVSGNLVTNDIDVDGDTLSISQIDGVDLALVDSDAVTAGIQFDLSGGGVVTIAADGSYTVDPAGAYEGLPVGQSASESFTYTVSDGNGGTDTATVNIDIDGVNDDPDAQDDSFATDEDTGLSGNVLVDNGNGADSDVDNGDTLTVTAAEADGQTVDIGQQTLLSSGALLTLNSDGTFDYDPNGQFEYLAVGESAFENFTYTVSDGNGGTNTASVTITIDGVNDDPTAVDDTATVGEDDTLATTIVLTGNDTDPDTSDDLEITSIDTTGTLGTVTVNADGDSVDYTPNGAFESLAEGETAEDVFTYTVSDGNGGTDTATVRVTVTGENDDPDAIDDLLNVAVGDLLNGNVLSDNGSGADSDVDTSDVLEVLELNGEPGAIGTATALASGALVTLNADGTFSYDQNGAFSGLGEGQTETDSFEYTVGDDSGGTDTATVTITIGGSNVPPVAVNDSFTTDEDSAFTTGSVLANDEDANGDSLTVTSVNTTGTVGLVVNNGDGTFDYNPNGQFESLGVGESATDSFTYTVSDGNGGTDTATVTITIDGVNDDPDAQAQAVTTGFATSITIDLLDGATDVDGDTITLDDLDLTGLDGTVVDNGDGTVTFTPGDQFTGVTSFAFTVTDGQGGSDTETVDITVADPGARSIEVASVEVTEGDAGTKVLTFELIRSAANASDLSVIDVIAVATGDLSAASGSDYEAIDLEVAFAAGETSKTVSVTVNGDTDVEGDETFALTLTNAGVFGDLSLPSDVTGTILNDDIAVNDEPPVAGDDVADTDEDTNVSFNLLDNDTDANEDPLVVSQVRDSSGTVIAFDQRTALPEGGFITVQTDGSVLFEPAAEFEALGFNPQPEPPAQEIQLSYTVVQDTDTPLTDDASVLIRIRGVNDAPEVTPIVLAVGEDDGVDLDLLAGATDVDGGALSVEDVVITASDGRAVTVSVNGSDLEIDAAQFNSLAQGEALVLTAEYLVSDGFESTANTAEIAINGANDDPDAQDDDFDTLADASLSGNVLDDNGNGADSDVDASDTLQIRAVNGQTAAVGQQIALASGALLTLNADGTFDYNPNGQFDGLGEGASAIDSFTYEVSDGNGGTDTATVSVTVTQGGVEFAEDDTYNVTIDTLNEVGTGLFRIGAKNADTDLLANDTGAAQIILINGAAIKPGIWFDGDDGGQFRVYSGGVIDFRNQGDAVTVGNMTGFTYTVSDGNGGTDSATVTVTITPGDFVKDDVFEISGDALVGSQMDIFRLAEKNNDTDLLENDGGATQIIFINGAAIEPSTWFDGDNGGQFRVGTGGVVDFRNQGDMVHPGEMTGFTYTAIDANGFTDDATVTLKIGEDLARDDTLRAFAEELDAAGTNWFRVASKNDDTDILENDFNIDEFQFVNDSPIQPGAWFDGDNGGQFRVFSGGVVDFRNQGDPIGAGDSTSFTYAVINDEGELDRATVTLIIDDCDF